MKKCKRHSYEPVNSKLEKCIRCDHMRLVWSEAKAKAWLADPDCVTVQEAARILGKKRIRVSDLKTKGLLDGGYGLVTRSSLEDYMKRPHKAESPKKKGVADHTTARPTGIKNHQRVLV